MTALFLFFLLLLPFNNVYAKPKTIYKLPKESVSQVDLGQTKTFIAASDKGLFKVTGQNQAIPLWTEGSVEQILRSEKKTASGDTQEVWYFRTSMGILYSEDLENFSYRNGGLPYLTIKDFNGENTAFHKQVQTLKDISIDPTNPLNLATSTKDNVYVSRDGGLKWKNIGSQSRLTSGIKAVAIVTLGGETVAFMSHPIFGVSYYKVDSKNPGWIDTSGGFDQMPTMKQPDEVSDILPIVVNKDGVDTVEIYMAQTFIPRLYKYNWDKKRAECFYRGEEPSDTYDGLNYVNGKLLFTKIEGVSVVDTQDIITPENTKSLTHFAESQSLALEQNGVSEEMEANVVYTASHIKELTNLDVQSPKGLDSWKESLSCVPGHVNAAFIPYTRTNLSGGVALNELYLLYPQTVNTPYGKVADEKKSLYASAYQCRTQEGIDKFRALCKNNNLNSLVIDMKDDYGLLRYDSHDSLVLEKGQVTQYAVNLDHFVSEFKKDNIYLVARIVTFKDRKLCSYAGGKYAVWDNNTNAPWQGIRGMEDEIDEETGEVIGQKLALYDENWVDPYCPEVWEYNVKIANELIARGFDEIQFDYIRFPTDGTNLEDAYFRYRSNGMDKESALVSFLRYARENIKAPIGIDIYGANGWYRSGTRTGQDVEMLAEYVDVIGPMFYPSHFENGFLNYEPFEERPYRIYFYGTYRNTIMARNRVIVRPWVQAFRLNVSYDRQYYNTDYVQKEIFGVRDSVDKGYMYWNNSGEYTTISPDVPKTAEYTGPSPEADPRYRRPSIGLATRPIYKDEGLLVLDSVYYSHEAMVRAKKMLEMM